MPAIKLKSAAEMEIIRKKQAVIDEARLKNYKPEANVSTPLAYFEIGRYTSGSFRGLFVVSQLLTEDAKGHNLKKPIKKIVADGVDMFVAITSLETALRKRVFK
jgi:hypothetical protein